MLHLSLSKVKQVEAQNNSGSGCYALNATPTQVQASDEVITSARIFATSFQNSFNQDISPRKNQPFVSQIMNKTLTNIRQNQHRAQQILSRPKVIKQPNANSSFSGSKKIRKMRKQKKKDKSRSSLIIGSSKSVDPTDFINTS